MFSVSFPREKIKRKFTFFGKYQKYALVNLLIFSSHSMKLLGIHLKKVNILYILSSKDDLFINITVSRTFHTVKFELDNERHFHARITINMVYFNGNYLEPLIRKSTISKV